MARHGRGITREAVALAQLVELYRAGGADRLRLAMTQMRQAGLEDVMQTLESAVAVIVGLTTEEWSERFIAHARKEHATDASEEATRLRLIK